jgi:hypothetical protein
MIMVRIFGARGRRHAKAHNPSPVVEVNEKILPRPPHCRHTATRQSRWYGRSQTGTPNFNVADLLAREQTFQSAPNRLDGDEARTQFMNPLGQIQAG